MRLSPVLVALSFFGIALAGCLENPEPPVVPSETAPAPTLPTGIVRFAADGSILAPVVDQVLAQAQYILTGHRGAEPTMGITKSGAIFMATFETVIRSTDGGQTWEVAYDFAVPGAPVDPFFNADPMMWVDPITDRVYNAPMYPLLLCSSIVWSENDGQSWTHRPLACPAIQPFDRQTLASGPPGPRAPPQAGLAHPTVLYLCYNQLASTSCLMSYDGGLTWPVNVPVWDRATAPPGSGSCAGQPGHTAVAPDGTVVVPKSWFCAGLFLSVSYDSGLTWEVRAGPQVGGDTLSPEVAFAPDGTLYALWQGKDHLTYLARSPDVGKTWDGPWIVSPPDVRSTVFAALAAGDDGRVAMAFLGTRDTDEYPSRAPDETRWHLFFVTTEDGTAQSPTFTAYQATPEDDPVQIGCVWIGGGGNPCRNMLDFIDGAVGADGTFYVSYTEGCTEGCAGVRDAGPTDSRDRQAALGILRGWSLRASA
ncbi:MAG TPA: sialidase family protein [Candidatus Thermoplasmatota archaeon]|nr:sialidase family protein [Candidatus Thermoplasmatota archaeon]